MVLDDDPTGSQEATGVPVLLSHDGAALVTALDRHDTVYVITNSRALTEDAATDLYRRLDAHVQAVARRLDRPVDVVLRGDSTLRGHVFAESDVFARPGSTLVLCPAFPSGGRRTVGGVHEVRIDGRWVNAADTEFARDPVFGFRARDMRAYVAERSGRPAVVADATTLRAAVAAAGPAVVVVDARTDAELHAVADALRDLAASGVPHVVRCAAPLAAILGGVKSDGLVDPPTVDGPLLVVTGSHTAASSEQLARLAARYGDPVTLPTSAAMTDPATAAGRAADVLRARFARQQVAILATERVRSAEHATLAHGAQVMAAVTATVRGVAPMLAGVVAKGGITSFEVAHHGLGLEAAWVVGQLAVGVSLWRARPADREIPYVVVPGNVGAADTMLRLVQGLDGSLTRVDVDEGDASGRR